MRPMAYVTNAESTPVFKLPTPTVDPTTATAPPAKLDLHESSRINAAASAALRLFPGPIGETLHREIDFYRACGVRTDQSGLLPRLIDHLLTSVEDHR